MKNDTLGCAKYVSSEIILLEMKDIWNKTEENHHYNIRQEKQSQEKLKN